MKLITIYLLILALVVRTESLNAKLGEKSIKSLFTRAKKNVVAAHHKQKDKVLAERKAFSEGEKVRRKVLEDEMERIRNTDYMDQGVSKKDYDLKKKYHLVGSHGNPENKHATHKVKDSELKALQLDLEKKVLDDIDHFVQEVGAY